MHWREQEWGGHGRRAEVFHVHPTLSKRGLMLSQVHFNQPPLEFMSISISESFAKFPFP